MIHYTNTNNPIDFPKMEPKMNKRIEDFAEQAGFLNKDEESIAYFAELIIRECMNICGKDSLDYRYIKEHFGVKE